MEEKKYEITLKKKEMVEIVSVLKKANMLGDQFVITNDIIVIPPEFRKINGVHCIKHGIKLPTDEFSSIQYKTPEDINLKLKQLTDAKGISKITLEWSAFSISIQLIFNDGDRQMYNLANSSEASHTIREMDNMLPKRTEYVNIYDALDNIFGESKTFQLMDEETLRNIGMGKVVEFTDHNGGIVRISKNLFPCIGAVRKGTVPDMDVIITTYTKGDNNILTLRVRYKGMFAVHAYYYDPIMGDK